MRHKNRFLVCQMTRAPGPTCSDSDIYNALKQSIHHGFGEFGLGASEASLTVGVSRNRARAQRWMTEIGVAFLHKYTSALHGLPVHSGQVL